MRRLARLAPRSMEGQLVAMLALSFALLLTVLAALEVLEQESVEEWAQNQATLGRLRRMKAAVELMSPERVEDFLAVTSSCHEGYTLTHEPFGAGPGAAGDNRIARRIATALTLAPAQVRVSRARLTRDDFSYAKCQPARIELPADGLVISLGLASGAWLNAEIHPHEWHVRQDMLRWVTRSVGAFLFVGAIAVVFVRRVTRPLAELTRAARTFGSGLEVSEVAEGGPPDLKRAIRGFNAMQRQVADEVQRRLHTLAAISHDVRTPLTALRIKAELVEEEAARRDLIISIEAMERITASALEFLRGERRTEPMRQIDLGALVESECSNFEEAGWDVTFAGATSLRSACRPDALACAVRNLIDNAVKYGGAAEVALRCGQGFVAISVSDRGPGIPEDRVALALEPFERLSRGGGESDRGGFGLGLAIARAIAVGHGGELSLEPNLPSGLVATIRLPRQDREP